MIASPFLRSGPHAALAAVCAWLLTVGGGFGALLVYGYSSGAAGRAPERFDETAGLQLATDRATLLLFAHPHCPCTRATFNELERLVAQVDGRLAGYALFFRPAAAEEGWERTDLWRHAEAVPGVRAVVDLDGRLARRFGAQTSGHCVVYDPTGTLVFQGGLTAARAHEGDNRGRDAVRHYINEGVVVERETPVYGCSIFGETPEPAAPASEF